MGLYLPDKYFVSLQWISDIVGGSRKVRKTFYQNAHFLGA